MQARLFRELLLASRREHALHGRHGVASRAPSGAQTSPTMCPQTHADGRPASAPPWSHIVACRGASVALWYAWSRARPREAPWRTAAAGHVTGPAPQGRPPWLHAQRACAHFGPSEPLWVQLLQKPRACQYKGVCMGFANVQVSFKKHAPLQNLLSSSDEGPMQLTFGHRPFVAA